MFYAETAPITSVIIDNGVTSIEDDEFNNYPGLVKVVIPNSVTNIGIGAFDGCALPNVTIPNSVTSIGAGAFGSTGLTNVTIGNGVTDIGNQRVRRVLQPQERHDPQ